MSHPTLKIGQMYLVDNPAAKTYVGRLTHIIDPFTVALAEAAWISDSGLLGDFITHGKAASMEIEVVGDVPATRYQSIIVWKHGPFKESVRG